MMSELSPNNAAEVLQTAASAAPSHAISVGSTLRQAREHSGMSVSEVSSRIKFAPRQIEALEADDFAQLPEIAFVRGFVRSYARLLMLDEEVLLGALPQSITRPAPEDAAVLAEVPFPNAYSVRKPNIMWLGAALAVALVLGLFVWLHGNGPNAPERQAKVESLELPDAAPMKAETDAPAAMVAAPVAPLPTVVQATPQPVAAKPAAQPAPVVQAAPQAAAKPAPAPVVDTVKPAVQPAQPVTALAQPVVPKPAESKPVAPPVAADVQGLALIHFSFDNESWVEVKDKHGQTLMAQLNAQGSERYVRGEPPFTLLVGNSGGVRLTYKGKIIDLAPHSSAQVAHLTLE